MANGKLIREEDAIANIRKRLEIPAEYRVRAINAVEMAEPVDAVEVVHGRWIWKDGECFCSVCSEKGEPKYHYESGEVEEYPYCPNCGAKMDGERRE